MKNKLGFWSIVLLTINSIIGTGIFLTPASVISMAGTYTPLVYLVTGIFAGILALTFASAAKYVSTNGAGYAYAYTAFGRPLGFYVGITRWVVASIAWGVLATAVVRTTITIFVGVEAASDITDITLGFLVLMVILLVINIAGTYITKIVNNISTIGKVGVLVFTIVAGLIVFLMNGENHFNDITTMTSSEGEKLIPEMSVSVFVSAMLAAFYAFTGFESVASAASEMDEPEKNLPRAIPLAIIIISLIYISIVTIGMMVNTEAIVTSPETVKLAAAFDNDLLKNIITYGAVISMFGINVAGSFSTPRIFEALSENHQLPEFFSRKNKRGVPVLAFIVTAMMAIVIPLSFQYDMKGIIVISSISRFVQFLLVPLALILFYYGKSKYKGVANPQRNFKTDVIVPVLAFGATGFLMYKFDWKLAFTALDAKTSLPIEGELNWYAIGAMIIGYVVIPLLLFPVQYMLGKRANVE